MYDVITQICVYAILAPLHQDINTSLPHFSKTMSNGAEWWCNCLTTTTTATLSIVHILAWAYAILALLHPCIRVNEPIIPMQSYPHVYMLFIHMYTYVHAHKYYDPLALPHRAFKEKKKK